MTNNNAATQTFYFGFGNIECYLKKDTTSLYNDLYYVGANGSYTVKIINEDLFFKNFNSITELKTIHNKIRHIIINANIKAINMCVNENSTLDSINDNKSTFEKLVYCLLSNDDNLSQIGISIIDIQIKNFCFRTNYEPILIVDNKQPIISKLWIYGILLITLAIIVTTLIAYVVINTSTSSNPLYAESTTSISYEVGEKLYDSKNNIQYIVNDNGTLTFTKYDGNKRDLTIPNSYQGIKVTKIGEGSFAHYSFVIDNLIISEGIEELSQSAFIFSKIKNITLPSTLKTIDLWQNPFRFNTFIKISISSDNSYYKTDELGKYLLSKDGTELYTYTGGLNEEAPIIPNSVKIIHNQAFANTQFISVKIPNGVETIHFSAFLECKKLEYVFIPQSVIYMSGSVFSCARNLKEIEVDENNRRFYSKNGILYEREDTSSYVFIDHIPTQITSREYKIPNCDFISSGAMCGNDKVVILTIPNGVKKIFSQSFISCTNLKVVYIPPTIDYLADDIFEYDYENYYSKTIYIEEGTQADISTNKWKYAFITISIQNNEMHITKINTNGQQSLNIPESINGYKIVIDDHAFDGIKNITIYGDTNGYVQSFAKNNGYRFILETKGNN